MFTPIHSLLKEMDSLERTAVKHEVAQTEEEVSWEETIKKINNLPPDFEKIVKDTFISHPERVWKAKTPNGMSVYVRGNGLDGHDVYLIWREKWGKKSETLAEYVCWNNKLKVSYSRELKNWANEAEEAFAR